MNSLKTVSPVAPSSQTSPSTLRSASPSQSAQHLSDPDPASQESATSSVESEDFYQAAKVGKSRKGEEYNTNLLGADRAMDDDEKTPLLRETRPDRFGDVKTPTGWRAIPKRLSSALVGTIRVVVATIAVPFRYVIACFYDEDGLFSPLFPFITIYRALTPRRRKRNLHGSSDAEKLSYNRFGRNRNSTASRHQRRAKRNPSVASSSTAVATDSEFDEMVNVIKSEEQEHARPTRSRSSMSPPDDEISPARRSIRIKLHNDEISKRRRQQETASSAPPSKEEVKEVVAASLKSPSSPGASKLTKFPRTPAPPRPLIPRRQPSYSKALPHGPHQKTLIIDLDETLIHSHSKGGRFATGHMVEVKMQHSVGVGGTYIGPQIPILYYVHKRPYCDEFLRKVSKWYNLVIFTASVQEYADPVIDWLELERKYFSGRYYRQHCTQRNGAYIKDLSQVEPDLSKVMILDNSPVSYIFHEDNAIPIEGWISDPTDNDLLNLVPLLEGLQHVTDVRALLALRLGQPQVDVS